MLPLIVFSGFGLALSIIDLKEKRLPNKLNLALVLSLISTVFFSSPIRFRDGITFGVVYFLVFLFLQIISRGSLGMGDVKYSASCGFIVGYYAKSDWLTAIWLIFSMAALIGLLAVVSKKANLKTAFAFAPAMTLGTIFIALNSL